jgi:tRNA modification GTPase
LRDSADAIESEGVRRSKSAANVADLVLLVCDGSEPLTAADAELVEQFVDRKALIVGNKRDLGVAWLRSNALAVSAATGEGLDDLRAAIFRALDIEILADRPALTNVRHIALVDRALAALQRARDASSAAAGAFSEEFVLADLQDARGALEEITGRRAPEDVLAHIFAKFCVGK